MEEPIEPLIRLLNDVILPNLKAIHASQAEQIAANDRLENEIEELRVHLNSQFAQLAAVLTACRAELATTQAILQAVQQQEGMFAPDRAPLVH
jgi:chromosomal replication initiation ATPase DnaA